MLKPTRHAKTNYRTLQPLLGDMLHTARDHKRYELAGLLPLVIEKLHCTDHENRPIYSLAHYGQQNGDAMRDPEVTFSVDESTGTVEPLTYLNDYLGVYQEVYHRTDDSLQYAPRLRTELDDLLWQWLQNLQSYDLT